MQSEQDTCKSLASGLLSKYINIFIWKLLQVGNRWEQNTSVGLLFSSICGNSDFMVSEQSLPLNFANTFSAFHLFYPATLISSIGHCRYSGVLAFPVADSVTALLLTRPLASHASKLMLTQRERDRGKVTVRLAPCKHTVRSTNLLCQCICITLT